MPATSVRKVVVPLFAEQICGTADAIRKLYAAYYKSGVVRYCEGADESGFLSAAAFAGRDDMQIAVYGNDRRLTLTARFDNLGKGASGAAIQNMNIVLGLNESTGLNVGGIQT